MRSKVKLVQLTTCSAFWRRAVKEAGFSVCCDDSFNEQKILVPMHIQVWQSPWFTKKLEQLKAVRAEQYEWRGLFCVRALALTNSR